MNGIKEAIAAISLVLFIGTLLVGQAAVEDAARDAAHELAAVFK